MGLFETKHTKRLKQAEIVNIEDFFDRYDAGGKVEEYTKPKGIRKIGVFWLNIIKFFTLSIILGVILSLIPLTGATIITVSGEPFITHWKELPSELDDVAIAERNVMYDKNGKVFAQVWAENRIAVETLDEISPHALNALISTEDKRFYTHSGFDPIGTARSALRSSGGGSGITQQLVKNLQFYNQAGKAKKGEAVEHSLDRKIRELKLSLEYEKTHTKDEILLEYFNTVSFGGPNIYSIQAASKYFFGKDAKDLTIAESAALVGSVQNTSLYNLANPDNEEKWQERKNSVINRLLAEKYITETEAQEAKDEKLHFKLKGSNGNCTSSKYPFYCEYVLDYMKNNPALGETEEERAAVLSKGGLQIRTYLDPKELKTVEEVLSKNFGTKNRVVAPVAIVEPGTGGVTAIGVNRKFGQGEGETEFVVPQLETGTGSTYKMFTLAAAVANGVNEKDLTFASQCPWRNPNYDTPPGGVKNSVSCSLQGGKLNYKQATAYSSNTWFTELEVRTGINKVKEFSRNVGLSAPDYITNRSVSYTLGVTPNSPISMAAAFATFANEGIYCPATPVKDYSYADGSKPAIPDTYNPENDSCKRVMSPQDAGIVLKAMKANVSGEIENAFGNDAKIRGYDIVGKTGTNQLFNLTWAQLSANRSLFINVYDMEKLTNEVEYITYKGFSRRWSDSAALDSGLEIMKNLIKDEKNIPLKYNTNDDSFVPVKIDKKDFIIIPNVIGMQPDKALAIFESMGITSKVLKETKNADNELFPSGVIIEQSVEPGTELASTTNREVELTMSR